MLVSLCHLFYHSSFLGVLILAGMIALGIMNDRTRYNPLYSVDVNKFTLYSLAAALNMFGATCCAADKCSATNGRQSQSALNQMPA